MSASPRATSQVLAPGWVPLFLTDGLKDYGTALLTHFGHWRQPEQRQAKGMRPQPRWIPLPELLYAQVMKSYRRRRIVGVKHRVVFGTTATPDTLSTAKTPCQYPGQNVCFNSIACFYI